MLKRILLIIHWVTFLAFVTEYVNIIYWFAVSELASFKAFFHIFRGGGDFRPFLFMWGLPVFYAVDWILSGKLTIFPWRRRLKHHT